MKLKSLAASAVLITAGCSAGTERDEVPEAKMVPDEVDFGAAEQSTSDEDAATAARASEFD